MLCGSLSSRPGVSIDLEAEAQPCSLSALLLCVWFRLLDPCTHGGDTSLAVPPEGPLDWVCPIEEFEKPGTQSPALSKVISLGHCGFGLCLAPQLKSQENQKPSLPLPPHPPNLQIILQQAVNKYL